MVRLMQLIFSMSHCKSISARKHGNTYTASFCLTQNGTIWKQPHQWQSTAITSPNTPHLIWHVLQISAMKLAFGSPLGMLRSTCKQIYAICISFCWYFSRLLSTLENFLYFIFTFYSISFYQENPNAKE